MDDEAEVAATIRLGLKVDTNLKDTELTTGGLSPSSTLLFWAAFSKAANSIRVMCFTTTPPTLTLVLDPDDRCCFSGSR